MNLYLGDLSRWILLHLKLNFTIEEQEISKRGRHAQKGTRKSQL